MPPNGFPRGYSFFEGQGRVNIGLIPWKSTPVGGKFFLYSQTLGMISGKNEQRSCAARACEPGELPRALLLPTICLARSHEEATYSGDCGDADGRHRVEIG